jgi:flavin-dependent dehydrogenase
VGSGEVRGQRPPFDVAIVGGGPVGLVAAIEARLRGLTVVVIDPRDAAIDKACGEGLMPGALPILDRLGVEPIGLPIMGITYLQGSRSVTHRFLGPPGRGVRRIQLSEALSARSDALGVERVRAKVEHLEQSGTEVSVGAVSARYLLACDGLHSSVAALAGLAAKPTRRRRRYGLRQHFAAEPWADTVEVYYGRSAEIYVTPIADRVVGIAVLGPRKTDFGAAIAEIPSLAARLSGAETVSTLRGAGPFRTKTRARVAGRVLLVGDASGYVDAITGEGLRLGFAQAEAAVAAIAADDPTRYEKDWLRITRDFRVTTTTLVGFATSPLRRAIVPLAALLPGRFGAVVESLAR